MKKQKTYPILFFLLCTMILQGCGNSKNERTVAGKTYTYTGESFSDMENDNFVITINEDGTFTYCESMLSSYIGIGEWSVEDGILTLSDDEKMGYPLVNHFLIDGEDIVFVEKDSSNFIYIEVKDGERFTGTTILGKGKWF